MHQESVTYRAKKNMISDEPAWPSRGKPVIPSSIVPMMPDSIIAGGKNMMTTEFGADAWDRFGDEECRRIAGEVISMLDRASNTKIPNYQAPFVETIVKIPENISDYRLDARSISFIVAIGGRERFEKKLLSEVPPDILMDVLSSIEAGPVDRSMKMKITSRHEKKDQVRTEVAIQPVDELPEMVNEFVINIHSGMQLNPSQPIDIPATSRGIIKGDVQLMINAVANGTVWVGAEKITFLLSKIIKAGAKPGLDVSIRLSAESVDVKF